MPIQLKEENDGKILAVHISGQLAKADYENFVPEFEQTRPASTENCACCLT